MSLSGAIIVPHPPLILPSVGRGDERGIQATIDAYRRAAAQVKQWDPEVLIISSPHLVMYADYFHISPCLTARGDMAQFRAPETCLEVTYDIELRREIINRAQSMGIPCGTQGEKDPKLDHGTFIPLWFLREAGVDCPIVRMGLSGLSPLTHYRLGRCVAEAVQALDRRAVFVASGDLSHKLKADGPYGFAPEGPEFDAEAAEIMASGDFLRFLTMDEEFCDRAAECGLRSFQIMAGALDGLAVRSEMLSHEGPFGVGYGVAVFSVTGSDPSRRYEERYLNAEAERLAERKAAEDPWVRLARLSLETYVKTGCYLDELPEDLPPELTEERAGAFVSLHVRSSLRGCIGTIAPVASSVAVEIVCNAVSAGTRDPRFPPVGKDELDSLEYSVDVLGAPERIDSPEQLDVKRYGVIVSCGDRRGLLLPDLEGVDTVESQISIALQKGGIRPGEPYTLERFTVTRHR